MENTKLSNRGKVVYNSKMVRNMMGSLRPIRCRDLESISGEMGRCIEESGGRTR